MRNIALEIAYDGTGYAGWQIQANAATVQGVLEAALSTITKDKLRLRVAGRTDAGVHALGQVASFKSASAMTELEFQRALNALIPSDIRILRVFEVHDGFHPRYSARARWYRYIISNAKTPSPFFRNYALWLGREVDCGMLSAYCTRLLGEHDFTSFSSLEDDDNPVRSIFSCSFARKSDFILFDIVANSFLRKMVRTLVGTFLELEREGAPPGRVDEIITSRNRAMAGKTEYPGGLYLVKVYY